MDEQKLKQDLADANAKHLHWLETFSAERKELHVEGVDVLRVFGYDLMQVFNHEYLKERLGAS